MKAIDVQDLSVEYDSSAVLKDVNFVVEEGDFLGIMGPNGGGKTTLLKTLLGLISPDRGEVKIFGRSPDEIKGEIGYVPQHSKFDADFPITVHEVVMMGRLYDSSLGSSYSEKDEEIGTKALEKVKMSDRKNSQISELSGGQLQRVLIARALAVEPEILLLDEPTASVDEKVKANIYDILAEMNEAGETIVLSTHDIGVISSRVKSIACLNKDFVYHGEGKITAEDLEETYGCPVDLIAHGQPHRVFERKIPPEEES